MFQLSKQSRACMVDEGDEDYNACPLTVGRCTLKSSNNDLDERKVENWL